MSPHNESVSDFHGLNGKSPFVCLGEVFRGTGNANDYDVSVENGYYFHEPGSSDHYLFFTGRNLAQRPARYVLGYAKAKHAYGPYAAVRRLTELEADGVKSLSNCCVIKKDNTFHIFHDSVLGYIGTTPARIRHATTDDLDGQWKPHGVALPVNTEGHFDDNYLIDTRVIWDGQRWRMYYTSPRNVFDTTRAQGCAFAHDLNTWRRESDEPILDADIEGLAVFPYAGGWILMGCGPSNTPEPVPFRAKIYQTPDGLRDWRLVSSGDDLDCPDCWPGSFNFSRDENGLPFLIVSQTGLPADHPQPMMLVLLATVPERGAELLVSKASFDSASPSRADAAEILHQFGDGRLRFWVRRHEAGGVAQVFVRRPSLQDRRGGNRGLNFALTQNALQIGESEAVYATAALDVRTGEWLGLEVECRGRSLTFRAFDSRFLKVMRELHAEDSRFFSGSVALGATNCRVDFARVERFA